MANQEQQIFVGMEDPGQAESRARAELLDQQINVIAEQHDLQLREYPLEVLEYKYSKGLTDEDAAEIFIPEYQRDFVWLPKQQSRFIESLFLNLPIPPLFLGDSDEEGKRGCLEVIDGTQRLRTIHYFLNDKLELSELVKIPALNGYKFGSLPPHWKRRFKAKAIRVAILTLKLDEESRREMFDRLNSGGTKLQPMETRRGKSDGDFLKFIEQLAQDESFRLICPLPLKKQRLKEYEEMLLRFFAYLNNAEKFVHEVDPFLTEYLDSHNLLAKEDPTILASHKAEFDKMVAFVGQHFPNGFKKEASHTTVPRVRFEAIAVGAALALRESPGLQPGNVEDWLNSNEFKRHTRSDATNSRPKLLERIWFVRDSLLGREAEVVERKRRVLADDNWKTFDLFGE